MRLQLAGVTGQRVAGSSGVLSESVIATCAVQATLHGGSTGRSRGSSALRGRIILARGAAGGLAAAGLTGLICGLTGWLTRCLTACTAAGCGRRRCACILRHRHRRPEKQNPT